MWKGDSNSDPITVDALKRKAKQSDKNSRKSVTTLAILDVEGKFTEEKCPAHDAICHKCHKKVITVPTTHQDQQQS